MEPAREFWLAEDYHQKYLLQQQHTLLSAIGIPPTIAALVQSQLACKLNGYVSTTTGPERERVRSEVVQLSAATSAHLPLLAEMQAWESRVASAVVDPTVSKL